MPTPKSVTKIDKNGVHFVSNVDRVNYTIQELTRAAMRDVAKLVKKVMKQKIPKDSGDTRKNVGSWVRKDRDTGKIWLQVGIYTRSAARKKNKSPIFHAHILEFGSRFVTANPFLRPSVMENLNKIRMIQGQYLSKIEDENTALGLINESEEVN